MQIGPFTTLEIALKAWIRTYSSGRGKFNPQLIQFLTQKSKVIILIAAGAGEVFSRIRVFLSTLDESRSQTHQASTHTQGVSLARSSLCLCHGDRHPDATQCSPSSACVAHTDA